jgi:hypothetical protein
MPTVQHVALPLSAQFERPDAAHGLPAQQFFVRKPMRPVTALKFAA